METIKQKGGRILESLADYAQLSLQLLALKTADKSAKIASGFLTIVILAVIFVFSLLLLSVGGAILISIAIDSPWAGFLIVGAFYTCLGIAMIVLRKKLISEPLLNQMLPPLINVADKAEDKIEKAQDKIGNKLNLEKYSD